MAPQPPSPELRARVQALVTRLNLKEASARLTMATPTVSRILGGLPVNYGTLLLAERRLAEIEPTPTQRPQKPGKAA